MQRDIPTKDLERLYDKNDMARADCSGCAGCHTCCTGMGISVQLDPYDAFRLSRGLSVPFSQIPQVEWNMQEGMLLPNLKMQGKEEACAFLDENGRCSVHKYRPGFCRLFPLGRIYEENGFRYFLQSGECPKTNRSKVRIRKWLDQPDLEAYEKFVFSWHAFVKKTGRKIMNSRDQKLKKDVCSFMVSMFYLQPFKEDQNFYEQFELRLAKAVKLVDTIEWND